MAHLWERIEHIVWGGRDPPRRFWAQAVLRVVRTAAMLARDLAGGQLTLRAMGLVYTTLLSIVPLLALSFSVLKTFGVGGQIQPVLLNFLAPLGEMGGELALRIVQFIEKANVGVLGTVGLALLVYTAVALMQKIEESLNFIWHVPRRRPFGERFGRYLSVLLVGPLLLFSALGITATVMDIGLVRDLLAIDALDAPVKAMGRLVPYLLVIAAFTFTYVFVPNARVRIAAALAGGVVGGLAWQTAGWAFAAFVASSKNYAAIYSSLAILILFMIWLYLSWLILLFGASVAFYTQHPEYLYARGGEPRLSNRMRERLGLSVMSLIAEKFIAGEAIPSQPEFARLLGVPMHALQVVLDALERSRLLMPSGGDAPVHLLTRDPSLITVAQILETVRAAGEEQFLSPEGFPAPAVVDDILRRARLAVDSSVGGVTLRQLATQKLEGPAAAR